MKQKTKVLGDAAVKALIEVRLPGAIPRSATRLLGNIATPGYRPALADDSGFMGR